MTVNAARIGDRIREIVDDPAVLALVDQLRDGMDDMEYCSIAIGITRLMATNGRKGRANARALAGSSR